MLFFNGFTCCYLIIILTSVESCCPSNCNGHGVCTTHGNGCICSCYNGYTTGDCSQRTCPTGKAWSDVASGDEAGHGMAECSNRGHCDTELGQCVCDESYTGSSCNRLICPGNDCSGHGECRSMQYHASRKDLGTVGGAVVYNTNWDHDMLFGCSCSRGFFGSDCSQRRCPTGDDPLTATQVNEKQNILCAATSGTFTLNFMGQTTEDLSFDISSSDLQVQLNALSTLRTVSVAYAGGDTPGCSSTGHLITIEFIQNFGALPLLVADPGHLEHDGRNGDSRTLTITSVQEGTKENVYCSNRGSCDKTSGVCTCYAGYTSSDGNGGDGDRGDCGKGTAITICPGEIECSGHGYCSNAPEYKCNCLTGWASGDCSERTCSHDIAWFDEASEDNKAHARAECSGVGICDAITGECICAPGFEGGACERLSCPSIDGTPCSGNGECLNMATLAKHANVNGVSTPYTYGANPNDPATWDYKKVQGCLCDNDATGHDCSKKTCPFGDNPRTTGQVKEVQTITCTQTSGTTSFQLGFRSQTTVPISSDATVATLQAALEGLTTIGTVAITYSSAIDACTTDGGNTITIVFESELGDLPALTYVAASGTLITGFAIDTDGTGTSVMGTVENVECSDSGVCDRSNGQCACFSGMGSSGGSNTYGQRNDCGYVIPR